MFVYHNDFDLQKVAEFMQQHYFPDDPLVSVEQTYDLIDGITYRIMNNLDITEIDSLFLAILLEGLNADNIESFIVIPVIFASVTCHGKEVGIELPVILVHYMDTKAE